MSKSLCFASFLLLLLLMAAEPKTENLSAKVTNFQGGVGIFHPNDAETRASMR